MNYRTGPQIAAETMPTRTISQILAEASPVLARFEENVAKAMAKAKATRKPAAKRTPASKPVNRAAALQKAEAEVRASTPKLSRRRRLKQAEAEVSAAKPGSKGWYGASWLTNVAGR